MVLHRYFSKKVLKKSFLALLLNKQIIDVIIITKNNDANGVLALLKK